MTNYATEILQLNAGVNYEPTFIRTDKRRSALETSTLGYFQIGELAQYGNARGPIFKIEFADTSLIATASHVKIWGIDNDDMNAPLYPISYLNTWRPILDVYIKKFIFCDSAGVEVDEEGNYTVIGYKRKALPTVY
jgi:hypothetical protein